MKEKTRVKNSLLKNTIFLSIGVLLTKGINLVMIPLFSSWLSTSDYGSFDLLCTYISLLIPFITLASGDAIFRFSIDKETIKEKRKYISTALLITLINCLIAIVIIVIIFCNTGWKYALPFALLMIVELFNNILQGFTRSIKKLDFFSYSSVITTIAIAGFVSLLILKYNMGLNGILYGYILGYVTGEVFLIFSTRFYKYISFKQVDKKTIKSMIKYSYPLIPNNISRWIINVSDRTFINLFLGLSYNGIYAIAYKIPNFCSAVFSTFNISWQESAVDTLNLKDRDNYYNVVLNKTLIMIISSCAVIMTLNFFMFNYIFDIKYLDGILFSPILITSVIFSTLAQYFGGIQISFKNTKENGGSTLIGAVINVVIDLLLIKFIGLYAAAISTLVSNISICLIRFFQLRKRVSFKIEKNTYYYVFYFLYVLIMAYLSKNIIINLLNIVISVSVFIIINKNIILRLFEKVFKIKIKRNKNNDFK